MPDLFDTSQIPDDPHYWDQLAERTTSSALQASDGFGQFVASRHGWIAAAALVAAAIVFMLIRPPGNEADLRQAWASAMAPSDATGRTITIHDRPPALGDLLFTAGAR
jgi:hypothetical protein